MTPTPNRPDPGRRERKPRRVRSEPAVVRGAVVSVLSLLTMLGFTWAADVDPDTVAVIVGAVLAILPLVQGLWTRPAVVPAAATLAYVDEQGRAVAGEAAVTPTGKPLATLGETPPYQRRADAVAVVPSIPPSRP